MIRLADWFFSFCFLHVSKFLFVSGWLCFVHVSKFLFVSGRLCFYAIWFLFYCLIVFLPFTGMHAGFHQS